jgi:hypothetical protein
MRRLAQRPSLHQPAQLQRQAKAGVDLTELGALALPCSLAALPETPPRQPSKSLPQPEHEFVDGPVPAVVNAPLPDEPGEMDLARLPAWMRGQPEHGPPELKQAQAAHGAAQHDLEELPPEW